MKSSRMSPGMNDLPPMGDDMPQDTAAKDSESADTKLSDIVDGLSDDECMQLQELLEERLGADLDEDNEEGEPTEHAKKVSDEIELE